MIKILLKLVKHPKLILTVLVAMLVIFGISIRKNTRIETDLDEYMPKAHPAFIYSDQMEEQFNIQDNILLVIEHPETIFNPLTLGKIRDLSINLARNFQGIEKDNITSLYTAENITSDEWGLTVEAFYTDIPQTNQQLNDLRVAVQNNEMIFGRIVSHSGKATLLVAEIDKDVFTDKFYRELQDFVSEYEGPETIYIAGRPVVEGELTKLGPKDMARMAPLVIIFITVILLLLLRSWRSTLINLAIVLFGTLTAFGLMAFFKVPVYTLSTMIPVMLIAIGVAYGIHMHNTIQHLIDLNPTITKDTLVKKSLEEMIRPVTMTAITTAIGFLSLTTSQVLPVRYFGLFIAAGVMMEMVMALVLFPASIYLLGVPKSKKRNVSLAAKSSPRKTTEKNPDSIGQWFGTRLLTHSRIVVIVVCIVVLLAVIGANKVWIDTSFLANFQDDSPVVQTDNFVNTHFGGTSVLNVILSSEEQDIFKEPEVLKRLSNLQQTLHQNPTIGDSFALTDFIKRMHQVMHDDDPAYNEIPETRDMIAQYLLLYEMSGDPENLDNVIDYDYKNANLTLRLKSDSSAKMKEVISDIEPFITQFAEYGIEINYAGSGYKSLVFATLLLEGQILSLLLSFLIVAILLAIVFKSWLIGIVGTIPIMITAIVNFGTMGALGIPLSSATAIISAIAIGIGVDYAIHLIERFQSNRRKGLSNEASAYETLTHTGKAIIFNTIAVMGGFSVLLISVFPPNRQVGGLIALNMAASALGTLTILVIILTALFKAKPNQNKDQGKS